MGGNFIGTVDMPCSFSILSCFTSRFALVMAAGDWMVSKMPDGSCACVCPMSVCNYNESRYEDGEASP